MANLCKKVRTDLKEKKSNKLKKHLKKHKTKYYCGVTAIGVATITVIIMKKNLSLGGWITSQRSDAAGLLANSQVNVGSNFSVINNNNYGKGCNSLSKIVSLDGTNKWWVSQAEAARELGISEMDLSRHLNCGRSLPNGLSLTRRGIAS